MARLRVVFAALICCAPWLAGAQALAPAGPLPGPRVACPAALFGGDLPSDKEGLRTELLALAGLTEACDVRADFHARRGTLLLSAGWPQEAAVALEKALLLNPELAGAQLDYAQALVLLGQRQQARDLVSQVAQRPDIEPGLKQWLQEGLTPRATLLGESAAGSDRTDHESGWSWAGLVQSGLGHESNLASATHTASLTLYLATGPVEVPLADTERPKSGMATKVLAATQGVRPLGDGQLRLNAAVQGRRAAGAVVADNQLAEGGLGYALPLGPGILLGTLGLHSFVQTGVYNYKDQAYSLKYEPLPTWMGCKWSGALSRTEQHYINSPSLDGHYDHFRLESACRPAASARLVAPAETIAGLSVGRDNPLSPDRPGGVKNRLELYARHEAPLTLPGSRRPVTLTAWGRYSHSRDDKVFSPLLGDAPARTHRQDFGLGMWWPLQPGWSAGLDVESTLQKSTNTLLNIRNLSVYGGVRWAWN